VEKYIAEKVGVAHVGAYREERYFGVIYSAGKEVSLGASLFLDRC